MTLNLMTLNIGDRSAIITIWLA